MLYNSLIFSNTKYIKIFGVDMGDSGIVRRVDELGRIVIPKEIRKSFRL